MSHSRITASITTPEEAAQTFANGVRLASQGYLFDAIHRFRALTKDESSAWADDALFNVGNCYLRMSLLSDAIETFDEVVRRFPDATIEQVGKCREFGRTAAKAHLGRVHAYLMLGDRPAALAARAELNAFDDSYVLDDDERVSFAELADRVLAAMPG